MHYQRDFTIGRKETQDFYRALALRSWRKGLIGFGVAGALAVWMYISVYAPDMAASWRLGACLTGAAAVIVTGAAIVSVSTSRKVRESIRKNGREHYVQQVEIDGSGVHVTVDTHHGKAGFDRLERIWETRKAFYLFLSANQAWILPKAQMENPAAESSQLRQIFSRVIGRGRLRLRKR